MSRSLPLAGADQARLDAIADWACAQPVRWINESRGYEWRYIAYEDIAGSNDINSSNGTAEGSGSYSANVLVQLPTWGAQRAFIMTDAVPSAPGPWKTRGDPNQATTYASATWVDDAVGGFYYVEPFWDALVSAVERGIPGADQAWATVQSGVSNLSAWRSGFAASPRWGSYPRNK